MAYPASWQAGQPQQGGSLYFVPPGGAKQGQNNSVELLSGAMIDYYVPLSREPNLDGTTAEFVQSLKKGDPSLKAEIPVRASIGGKPALLTKLTTKTSAQMDQIIDLYTVPREAGLWYLVVAAGPSQLAEFEPIFHQMEQSVLFPD